MKKISTLLFVTIFCSALFAGGFQINESGARAMGMGNAFTAVANDPSAIHWNGAGILNLYGTNIMLGTALIAPSTTFSPSAALSATPFVNNEEYKMESQIFFPSHFFATHRISSDFAAGLGFNTPYGLGTKWAENWGGRYLAVETELMTFAVSPVLAYRITDGLSISAGFVYSWANVKITRKAPQPAQVPGEAFIDMEGDESSAFGYNFGLMYKPNDQFSAGVSFRSQVEYNFEGTVKSTASAPVAAFYPNGDISADLTTPMNLTVGFAYKFTPAFLLAADFQYVGWESYDSLTVIFKSPSGRSSSARLYENSFIARLGAEYEFNNALTMQAGVYYDKNPVKDERLNPTLPESDRLGLSLGLSYRITGALGAQLSYLYIHSFEKTIETSEEYLISGMAATAFNGTYKSSASIVSLSLTYGF